jgi:hypothetical protein
MDEALASAEAAVSEYFGLLVVVSALAIPLL